MMAESQPSGIDHFPVASRGLPEVVVLTTEDVQELAQLEGMCFAQPWSLAQLRKALASDAYLALGLRVNGVLTAYASTVVSRAGPGKTIGAGGLAPCLEPRRANLFFGGGCGQ